MNATATYSSDHSWSRRCSTETVFSIQGKETDFARDTSDTDCESSATDRDVEYEPATESDERAPIDSDSSASDNNLIVTKVIEVCVADSGDVALADSERTDSADSDSEVDMPDFWNCAQCHAANNNPMYRFCIKCYQIRKNFFPPRPKRKRKRAAGAAVTSLPPLMSQDSGIESLCSQESHGEGTSAIGAQLDRAHPAKRRADSLDTNASTKRIKLASDTELDSDDGDVQPLVKSFSEPAITIPDGIQLSKKTLANSLKETMNDDDLCVICIAEPKTGVFVHGKIAHICCCYKCAVKVWAKAKRCPVCNCKVSNVLKAVVM